MFLKGLILWAWLQAAGRLPGRAFHVAVVIRLLAGMSKGAPVSLARACATGEDGRTW